MMRSRIKGAIAFLLSGYCPITPLSVTVGISITESLHEQGETILPFTFPPAPYPQREPHLPLSPKID
jgi:hypothetical protein